MLAFIVSATLTEVYGEPKSLVSDDTPFGAPSAPIEIHSNGEQDYAVLYRHGIDPWIAAHRVNYRANIWALREAGVTQVCAYATTGSATAELKPGDYIVPDQIIDYSFGREGSFETEGINEHFDFTYPFDESLRELIFSSAQAADLPVRYGGTYACSNGPRFETAAEVARAAQEGCDVMGMTLMPEAALARQIELTYASMNFIMNYGAGVEPHAIDLEGAEKYTDEAVPGMQRFTKELLGRLK